MSAVAWINVFLKKSIIITRLTWTCFSNWDQHLQVYKKRADDISIVV